MYFRFGFAVGKQEQTVELSTIVVVSRISELRWTSKAEKKEMQQMGDILLDLVQLSYLPTQIRRHSEKYLGI